MMLNEVRASSVAYDAAADTAAIAAPGLAQYFPRGGEARGALGLYDAAGFLVGVDLRGDDPRGVVVMLGPHEAVASTRDLRARVDGERVVVSNARAAMRGGEKSPYV